MADADRIRRGIEIRSLKKKRSIQSDVRIKTCTERYDNGAYSLSAAVSEGNQPQSRAHTEALQVTSEDDSDRDADAIVTTSQSSTPPPPTIATSTVTAVAASDDMCECDVCLIETRDRVYILWYMWTFSILLQLCGCRGVYTRWMPNL